MSEQTEKDELGEFARQVAQGVAERIPANCVSALVVMCGHDVVVASTAAKSIVDKMIVELALSITTPAKTTETEVAE